MYIRIIRGSAIIPIRSAVVILSHIFFHFAVLKKEMPSSFSATYSFTFSFLSVTGISSSAGADAASSTGATSISGSA